MNRIITITAFFIAIFGMTLSSFADPILICQDMTFKAFPSIPLGPCESNVQLEMKASIESPCQENDELSWQVSMDLWADGTVDRLGSSQLNVEWLNQWIKIDRYENGQETQAWLQLQAQYPDMILHDELYVTYIVPTSSADVTVKLPGFILSTHSINHIATWKITDNCGNSDQCNQSFVVKDTKAPTPICISLRNFPFDLKEAWAKHFDKLSFDGCTPNENLLFTFDEVLPMESMLLESHYYKKEEGKVVLASEEEYTAGTAYKWDPDLKSAAVSIFFFKPGRNEVTVSVWDEALNTDYCIFEMHVIGHPYMTHKLSGQIKTIDGRFLNDASVINESILPEFPLQIYTKDEGQYIFEYLPSQTNYTIHAEKEDYPINGVSTLDLVFIQRHILGIEPFDNPFKIMASDGNDDGRVTASDINEIRKLILGVKPRMINSSWRFPVIHQDFSMKHIFPYIEKYEFLDLNVDTTGVDFIAIKIGDVNGTAVIDLQDKDTEIRTSRVWNWAVANQTFKAGDIISIPVYSNDETDIYGCQLTFSAQNLTLVGIEGGILQPDESEIGRFENGKTSMSLALAHPMHVNTETPLFTLQFLAEDAGSISNNLQLTSDMTTVEYYTKGFQVGKINLRVNQNSTQSQVAVYQNEPNPFNTQTQISYFLPENGPVSITIHDMMGRKIREFQIDGIQGHHAFEISQDQIGTSGTLYYTFKFNEFIETKKMILLDK